MRFLKDTVCVKISDLKGKTNQGKVLKVTLQMDACNHFLPQGNFTRFVILVLYPLAFSQLSPTQWCNLLWQLGEEIPQIHL